jgi:hypothetical protein
MRLLVRCFFASVILFLMVNSAWGMTADYPPAKRRRCCYSLSHTGIGEGFRKIEEALFQQCLVHHELNRDIVDKLFLPYIESSSSLDDPKLITWVLDTALWYRLPLIIELVLMLPAAQKLPIEYVRDLLSTRLKDSQYFPVEVNVRLRKWIVKLPQIKHMSVPDVEKILFDLLSDQQQDINNCGIKRVLSLPQAQEFTSDTILNMLKRVAQYGYYETTGYFLKLPQAQKLSRNDFQELINITKRFKPLWFVIIIWQLEDFVTQENIK